MEPVFKANDGKTFATAREAELRNDVLAAEESLRLACSEVRRALAKAALTADGVPFGDAPSQLYRVHESFDSPPQVREVSCYLHNAEVGRESGEVVLRWYRSGDKYHEQPMNELYASRDAARAACVPLIDEWLACKIKAAEEAKRIVSGK